MQKYAIAEVVVNLDAAGDLAAGIFGFLAVAYVARVWLRYRRHIREAIDDVENND